MIIMDEILKSLQIPTANQYIERCLGGILKKEFILVVITKLVLCVFRSLPVFSEMNAV